jgi:1,2-diacylglycerol 3-beta-glucosyltransferase
MTLATALVILTALYAYALVVVSTRYRTLDESGPEELSFVLLVPALNEERVIGETIASLLALRGRFLLLVINDASDDGTSAAVAPLLADTRVRLLEIPPEQARRGKGHVLNAGYAAVRRWGLAEPSPENAILVVFDADTRAEPQFLRTVAPYFRDPTVAGVQSAVRMYNADQKVLTLWQHLEFAVWGKVFCKAKDYLGSMTLGGNGQCVRFSALSSFRSEPWQASSLTEDLDLSLRLLSKGWRLRFCSSVAVWQEAVPRLGALVRQRSRWLQGHVVCWQHLPALLRSRRPVCARLELLLFLLLPIVFLPIGLISVANWLHVLFSLFVGDWNYWDYDGDWDYWNTVSLFTWYVLGIGTAPLVVVAWHQIDRPPLWRLLLHSHFFVVYSFVWFAASARVYLQVLLGRHAWFKTSRHEREAAGAGGVKTKRAAAALRRRRHVDQEPVDHEPIP